MWLQQIVHSNALANATRRLKAVVAGPAGRRAPDHFLGRVCFPLFPFFLFRLILHFPSDFIQSSTIFLMQLSITLVARVINRTT